MQLEFDYNFNYDNNINNNQVIQVFSLINWQVDMYSRGPIVDCTYGARYGCQKEETSCIGNV